MNKSKIDSIIQTLSLIEVKGRFNMTLILRAILALEGIGQDGDDKGRISDALQCVDAITVSGKSNIDMTLGVVLVLDEILKSMDENKEEEEKADEEVKDDG